MKVTYFVNEAFDNAIANYIMSKDNKESVLYNSFLVVIIRMLVIIYGELDILNPYQIDSETALDNNLVKYGASSEKIKELKDLMQKFYQKECTKYFIDIQKVMIDIFNVRKNNFGFTENEREEFFDLLYTPATSNALRISYNYKMADNVYEVAEYFKTSAEEVKPVKTEEKDLLALDVYKFFGIDINDLSKMNVVEVDNLNSQIYKKMNIKESTMNKEYLLEEKIRQIQIQNNPITTGNGYVDILLIMSVIVTVIMAIAVFGVFVF